MGRVKLLTALLISLSASVHSQILFSFNGYILKGNPKRMTEYIQYPDGYMIRYAYSWDSYKGMEVGNIHIGKDITLIGKFYIRHDNSNIIERGLYCEDGVPCKKETYKYDIQGKIIEETIVDYPHTTQSFSSKCNSLKDLLDGGISNMPVNQDSIVMSVKSKYDIAGRLIEEKSNCITYGSNYNESNYIDKRIRTTSYKYDNNDSLATHKQEEWVRIRYDNADTMVDTTVEIAYYTYENGNKIEENIFKKSSLKGKADTTRSLFKYDTHNNLVERKEFFEINDDYSKPHSGRGIGAVSEYIYDSLNNMITDSYYYLYREDNGTETKELFNTQKHRKDDNNEEEDRREYDKQGNVTKVMQGNIVTFWREIEY